MPSLRVDYEKFNLSSAIKTIIEIYYPPDIKLKKDTQPCFPDCKTWVSTDETQMPRQTDMDLEASIVVPQPRDLSKASSFLNLYLFIY